jgi:protein-L-isoaspartate(D-aspartate) O-methyltransferase
MNGRDKTQPLRQALVDKLAERGVLADPRVKAAFLAVPRHRFLPPDTPLDQAYADDVVAVKRDPDGTVLSSSSQPTMMAMMLHQLQLQPGHNVLEIGAGTGYNAALMKHIVGDTGNITALEIDQELVSLAQNALQRTGFGDVRVVHADGAAGYSPRASYDRIIATVGVWDIPAAWVRQLKPHGLIVAPLWLDAVQVSAAFQLMADSTLYSAVNLPCGFIRLRGPESGPMVTRRVGSSSLLLTSNAIDTLDSAALHALLSDDSESGLLDVRMGSNEYWTGFVPYLMLSIPPEYTFAVYNIAGSEQAYGISGHGFALVSPGSACFVPYSGHGEAHVFGSPDSFMTLQDMISQWNQLGRPGGDHLRLRLYPINRPAPAIETGRLYPRKDHYLHVWQELNPKS